MRRVAGQSSQRRGFYSGAPKSDMRLPAMSLNMAMEPNPPGISVGYMRALPPRLTALSR